jgi:hypothetical protein
MDVAPYDVGGAGRTGPRSSLPHIGSRREPHPGSVRRHAAVSRRCFAGVITVLAHVLLVIAVLEASLLIVQRWSRAFGDHRRPGRACGPTGRSR